MKRTPLNTITLGLMLGVFLVAPSLAADDLDQPKNEPKLPATLKREDTTCPRVHVLGETDHMTVFEGTGRDVTDIVYKATLAEAEGTCKHRSGNQLNISVTAVVGAELGLAGKSHDLEIPLFIAVIDPEQLVVTKEAAKASLKIAKDSRTGAITVEPATVKLVLEEDTQGRDLEVLVGLQLDKDQLEFNRAGH